MGGGGGGGCGGDGVAVSVVQWRGLVVGVVWVVALAAVVGV